IESQTTVPWWFVGILHYRESGFREAHLHNGDPLTARTVHEPAGRPMAAPAYGATYTFIESAVDALRWKTFDTAQDRSIAAWIWRFEYWNGFGYAMRGINSEYLWNGTNHFGSGPHQGKYTADSRFDPNAKSEQAGAVAILWYFYYKGLLDSGVPPSLQMLDGSIAHATVTPNAEHASISYPTGSVAVATTTVQQPVTLQILDVFRYYQRLPHQEAAIAWLQQQLSPQVLAEFARRWRDGSANGVTGMITPPVGMGMTVPMGAAPPAPVQLPTPAITPVQPPAPPAAKPLPLAEGIIAYCQEEGYQIDRGVGEKNIIYVEGMYPDGRLNDDAFNAWNDTRMVIEFFDGVPKIIGKWEATTEPGRYYTMNPMNINGAARIKFGQYKAWIVGTHLNSHEALVQLGGPVTVYRDLNKDGMRTGDRIDTGQFGVNQHWGGDSPQDDIGRWSAGCLVGRTKDGHREFMKIIKSDPRYLKSKAYVFSSIVIPGDDLFKRYPPIT
ncbi:MAG TPA: hypothetical protein V6C85_09920, partial [Allocoleopsis sp.]